MGASGEGRGPKRNLNTTQLSSPPVESSVVFIGNFAGTFFLEGIMAEARAAVTRPDVRLHAEGTSTKEAEVELLKSTFKTLKKCAFRTR